MKRQPRVQKSKARTFKVQIESLESRQLLTQTVMGYFTNWGNLSVSSIPVDKVNAVNYAFASVSGNSIALTSSWQDQQNFTALNTLKASHPDLKTYISIGGAGANQSFKSMAGTASGRNAFADSCVAFLRQYGFNGVDLDWEPIQFADRNNFTALVQAIRTKIDAAGTADGKQYEVTAALPAGFDQIQNIDLIAIKPLLDRFNIMTYDFHGTWNTKTNHNSPLYADASTPDSAGGNYDIDYAIGRYLSNGIDPAKISMGVPFYSYEWTGVPSTNNGLFQTSSGTGTLKRSEVYNLLQNQPGTYQKYWDDTAKVPWIYAPNVGGGTYLTYEDQLSMQYKMLWLKDHNLGGTFNWELSQDISSSNKDSLLWQMNNAMGEYTPPTVTAAQFNSGNKTITYTFSEDVTAMLSSITVTNTATNQTVTPTNFSYDAAQHKATFTLPGALANGAYEATISGETVWDLAANRLDGDDNGSAGGTHELSFSSGVVSNSIAGTAFSDNNSNGIKDGGESGINGWIIYLDTNNNNVKDAGETSTATDASGNYLFANLANGSYNVKQVLAPGTRKTLPVSGVPGYTVVASGAVTGKDFGITTNILLAGTVYNDSNSNGVMNGGEAGMAGVVVEIVSNNQVIASRTTDAGGNWKVSGLGAGTGQARVVLPNGYGASNPVTAAYSGSMSSGQQNGNVNFGLIAQAPPPATFSSAAILSSALKESLVEGLV